jgi:hypothetical protein
VPLLAAIVGRQGAILAKRLPGEVLRAVNGFFREVERFQNAARCPLPRAGTLTHAPR